MQEFSDDRLARAFEALEQANRTLDQQQRDPVADVPYAAAAPLKWDPANPRGLTVKTMNRAEFNAWCDAGRPPLTAPAVAVTKAKVDALVRAAIAEERTNAQASLDAVAVILGDETGKADAKLAEQIRQLRIELVELKAELHDLRGERSTDALELPDWRHVATH